MNLKKIVFVFVVCLMFAGCGTLSKTEESEHKILTLETMTTENVMDEENQINEVFVESELESGSSFTDERLLEDTSVYSKPDLESSICGELKSGTIVKKIKSENGWYQVSYSGRVAYIPKEAFGESVDITEEHQNNTNSTRQGTTVTRPNNRPGNTTQNPNTGNSTIETPVVPQEPEPEVPEEPQESEPEVPEEPQEPEVVIPDEPKEVEDSLSPMNPEGTESYDTYN